MKVVGVGVLCVGHKTLSSQRAVAVDQRNADRKIIRVVVLVFAPKDYFEFFGGRLWFGQRQGQRQGESPRSSGGGIFEPQCNCFGRVATFVVAHKVGGIAGSNEGFHFGFVDLILEGACLNGFGGRAQDRYFGHVVGRPIGAAVDRRKAHRLKAKVARF